MKTAALTILAYCMVAYIAFGSIVAPVAFMTFWSDRLGASYWQGLVAVSVAIATLVFILPARDTLKPYRLPIFVAIAMVLSVLSVGLYADQIRRERLIAFDADAHFQHSFFRSLHEAPRDFQLYLHAAALKKCVPYAWSYRSMGFYPIPPRAAANVLPAEWLKRCPIIAGHDQ